MHASVGVRCSRDFCTLPQFQSALPRRLFLAKAHRLLDSDGEFLVERLECLIRGEIKTVETIAILAISLL